mgnify:CR=1 FL=1
MYNMQAVVRKNINNATMQFDRLGYIANNLANVNTIGYKTGYELLMINASITFLMLWVSSAKHKRLIIKG